MQPIAYDDAHEALGAALRHFEAGAANPGPPAQHLESYDTTVYPNGVPLMLNLVAQPGGTTRWDYGLPAIFSLEYAAGSSNQRHLQSFAEECGLATLPPQWKPVLDTKQINLQLIAGNRIFNFHLSVH